MTIHQFSRPVLPATRWKNGGGVTHEIVSSPRASGLETFTWRASIADVAGDGPFSVFDGVDRVIVLLDGKGALLRGDSGQLLHRLDEPFAPFSFPGEARITASLLAGPCSDFNVMTRRSAGRAEVRVVRATGTVDAYRAGVLYAARGRWTVRAVRDSASRDVDGREMSLDAGDGCWWESESLAWRVAAEPTDAANAVLLVAGIRLK